MASKYPPPDPENAKVYTNRGLRPDVNVFGLTTGNSIGSAPATKPEARSVADARLTGGTNGASESNAPVFKSITYSRRVLYPSSAHVLEYMSAKRASKASR